MNLAGEREDSGFTAAEKKKLIRKVQEDGAGQTTSGLNPARWIGPGSWAWAAVISKSTPLEKKTRAIEFRKGDGGRRSSYCKVKLFYRQVSLRTWK